MGGREKRRGLGAHLLLAAGVLIMLWASLEDHDASAVALLGAFSSACLCLTFLDRLLPGAPMPPSLLLSALAGMLMGALATVLAAGLMLFKDLLHGHIFPDYPPAMILAMLERLPPWTLAGGLAGLALGIARRAIASKINSP